MLEGHAFEHADRPAIEHTRSGLHLTPWGVISVGLDPRQAERTTSLSRVTYLGISWISAGLAAVWDGTSRDSDAPENRASGYDANLPDRFDHTVAGHEIHGTLD